MTGADLISPRIDDPHWVYRLFDQDGSPLYVGCTNNIGARLGQHSSKDWWSDVRGIEVEQYPTMREGLDAERAVIEAMQPKHNRIFTDRHDDPNGWRGRKARMAFCHDRGLPCRDTSCNKHGCAERWHDRDEPCANAFYACPHCRFRFTVHDYEASALIRAWDAAHELRTLVPLEAWVAQQEQAAS